MTTVDCPTCGKRLEIPHVYHPAQIERAIANCCRVAKPQPKG